jgi:predicted ATPase
VGKTRLGVHVAAELLDEFPHGVFFVPLTASHDPTLVVSAIAQTLGVKETGGQPLAERLKHDLHDKQMLLLLDNFEQVLPARSMLNELLATCPRLTVLVTSREVLRLRGEQSYPVPPLRVPSLAHLSADGQDAVSRVLASEAGRLFVDRAQSVRPAFQLTVRNAPSVAEICRRLDGLPLALELAAARIRYLPPEALLARLEHRLQVLTGGAHDVPIRQQTLRAAIDWSHDLLSDTDRRLFRRLAVFVGGFTLSAAQMLDAGGTDAPAPLSGAQDVEPSTLDLVGSLVEKSLLHPLDHPGRDPRFTMLETIREYAFERLAASGELSTYQRRHAEHVLALAKEAEPHLMRAAAGSWLDRLQAEHDNLRAALAWSADAPDRADVLARIVGALWWFWWMRGHFAEGRRWLDLALARTTDPAARITLLHGAGQLAFFQDQASQAREHWTEMAALGRAAHDEAAVAYALARLAFLLRLDGERDRAVTTVEESLAISRRLGDPRSIALALHGYAQVFVGLGDLDRAETAWTESLELFRQIGAVGHVPYALANLAHIARQRGELEKATALFEEGYALVRERDDKFGERGMVLGLLRVAFHRGDDRRVLALARKALVLGRDQGSAGAMALAMEALAWTAAVQGDAARAGRLLGSAEAIRATSGPGTNAPQPDLVDATLAAASAALGQEGCDAARAEGRATSVEEAIAFALSAPEGMAPSASA